MGDLLPGSGTRSRYVDALVALLLGGFTFAYRYLSFERFPNDHFVHLSRAQQVVMGALPVRDYSEYHAPLTAMLSAWSQMIFGSGLRSELLLVCGAFAVGTAATYLVAAAVSDSVATGVTAALILTAATPVSYSYPKVLPYALAFGAAWLYVQKPDSRRLCLLATSVVFAGLLRHDHAIALGAGAAVAVFTTHPTMRDRAKATGMLALAGLVLAGPYIAWVHHYEGLFNYIGANIEAGTVEAGAANWSSARFELDRAHPFWLRLADPPEPVVYVRWQPEISAEARHRAEQAHGLRLIGDVEKDAGQYEIGNVSAESLNRLLRDPIVHETSGIDRERLRLEDRRPLSARLLQCVVLPGEGLRPAMVALLYYLSWIVPLAVMLLLVARWTQLTAAIRSIATMAVAVQLFMCREMLRDPLATRVRDVEAPLVVLLALTVVLTRLDATNAAPDKWLRRFTLTAFFLITGLAAAGAGTFGSNLRETGLRHGWEGLATRAAEIRERYEPPYQRTGTKPSGLVEYVISCTSPQSRILALANIPELFFYAGRGFAGGYDAFWGVFATDRQALQVLERMSREDVPLVIFDSDTAMQMMNTYPRIATYVRQRYHQIARFQASPTKAFIVLAENDRKPLGAFEHDQLPCFAALERTQSLLRSHQGWGAW